MEERLAEARKRIIVAVDLDSLDNALEAVKSLEGKVGAFKIGNELQGVMMAAMMNLENDASSLESFYKARELFRRAGGGIMYDQKYHDIGETMGRTAKNAVSKLPIDMFTIHASAGVHCMQKVVANRGGKGVIAVTILTDKTDEECRRIYGSYVAHMVQMFVENAIEAGVQYIVCAPRDLLALTDIPGFANIDKIVPNIRPGVRKDDDQNKDRAMTPAEAIKAGATYLVIGRPITQPEDGSTLAAAADKIAEEISEALQSLQG